ncbi:MAG TPA: beta-ketoacyl-ACP synthase III [Candidatus Gastranaerophilaceae bacterium]|nr:beta-ketoacyl-ACP synthase III [Candidatus Gastranaerophilaceae bacterium]HPT41588.1 beta-ketoacyl-ACP synthase III [Candidatus Gastranaerophilaceae bacterium]
MTRQLIPLKIAGVGYCVPETVITNDDLTKLYDTSDEWIYTRTGIKERRVVSGEENAIDLGYEAAKNALKKANIKPEEIDMIIAASSAPADLYPAMACRIQAKLGVKEIPAFDVTAACSGLIYTMEMARAFIGAGIHKKILIVATDNNSRFCDWTDRSVSILFGDGAGAMVVTEAEDGINDLLAIDIKADGSIGEYITLPFTGQNCPLVTPCEEKPSHVKMNGREVYKFAVRIVPEYIDKCLEMANMKAEDVDYFIPHQANQRIIEAVQQRLGYSDEKVISNIKYYGNTSAASVPIALAEGVEHGKIKLPCTAILCGFGAGMTWGVAIVRLRKGIC